MLQHRNKPESNEGDFEIAGVKQAADVTVLQTSFVLNHIRRVMKKLVDRADAEGPSAPPVAPKGVRR